MDNCIIQQPPNFQNKHCDKQGKGGGCSSVSLEGSLQVECPLPQATASISLLKPSLDWVMLIYTIEDNLPYRNVNFIF